MPTHSLRFGIEDEIFLVEADGAVRGHSQRMLLRDFADLHSYRVTAAHPLDALPLQLNKDLPGGYCCIKFDSTYNILEVAYPPSRDLSATIREIHELRATIGQLAPRHGLQLALVGYHHFDLSKTDFFDKATVLHTLERRSSNARYFDRFYPGKICSTQVHLQLDRNETFKLLPYLYALEPLIPLFFSNSTVANVAHAFRPLIIQDAFAHDYGFCGFPSFVVTSDTEYLARLQLSQGFFRDYSLIVPRKTGTWEFRSADSQPSADAIRGLVQFRIDSLALARCLSRQPLPFSHGHFQSVYISSCHSNRSTESLHYLDWCRSTPMLSDFVETIRATTGAHDSQGALLGVCNGT